MTTVEAMACGVAVIAANHGGLGEVASGHALMLDHPSADNLLEALVEVLSHDALRADLKHRARERGKALRWDAISRQTLDIVRSVGAMRRRKSQ
jgi:glycosyltransferase involved in cell wall biosynthesis